MSPQSPKNVVNTIFIGICTHVVLENYTCSDVATGEGNVPSSVDRMVCEYEKKG